MREYDKRVNQLIAGRTVAEYRADNREKIAAQMREYRAKNREQIAAQRREYRQQPEVKARRNALARENRQRKKEQQHTASA